MRKSLGIASMMLLAAALVSSPALARDKDHDGKHDRDGRKEWRDHDRDHDQDDHRHHGRTVRDDDRDGDHDRDDRRLLGWKHGRKTGWEKCDVPPGQVKKLGCHPDERQHPGPRTVVLPKQPAPRLPTNPIILGRAPKKPPVRTTSTQVPSNHPPVKPRLTTDAVRKRAP